MDMEPSSLISHFCMSMPPGNPPSIHDVELVVVRENERMRKKRERKREREREEKREASQKKERIFTHPLRDW